MTANALPTTADARTRLREQQRRENELLTAVLAATTKLETQEGRYDRIVSAAQADVDGRRNDRDHLIAELAAVAGVKRTGDMLGLSAIEVGRLVRTFARKADSATTRASQEATQLQA